MRQYDIIIIGAGPAGLSAAIAASKSGARILLIDRNEKIGKKILVTGNGKCNLTNNIQESHCYRTDNPDKMKTVFEKFSYEKTQEFFGELGIIVRNKNGYIYPYNEQAASVREAFELLVNEIKNIEIMLESRVKDIELSRKGYLVISDRGKYVSDQLIITTGGYAGPKIGCDGSGYVFAGRLGHEIVKPLPALTPLKSGAPFLKKVSGVRNQAKITLLVDGNPMKIEKGELQWTDYGISGVAIFQLSRYAIVALEQGQKVSLSLDFAPEYDKNELSDMIDTYSRIHPDRKVGDLLKGFMPAKLIPVLVREARIPEDACGREVKEKELESICSAIKEFSLRINGYMGYEKAQVTRGGISLSQVTDDLESIFHPGLYFAGEVLDVDGTCGGYNLQWAFSSGNVAGNAAGRRRKNQRGNKKYD